MQMDISLSPDVAQIVRHKVDSGMYGSAEEVVEKAIHLLENFDELRERQLDTVRNSIDEARKSGPGIPAEEVFAELRRRLGLKKQS